MGKAAMAKVTWLKPKMVAQIKFAEWTNEGLLRQPVFLGLRQDKSSADVRREPGPL
jgi:bifunctional non-homologous end joining protein LigD